MDYDTNNDERTQYEYKTIIYVRDQGSVNIQQCDCVKYIREYNKQINLCLHFTVSRG